MAKLERITNKIFGSSATAIGNNPQIGQFGSALAGTYVGTTDISEIQALPAWGQGWIGAVTPTDQFPALPEMTGVMKVMSYQTGYLHQEGISEYDSNTVYYKGSIVKDFNEDYGVVLYYSLTDDNQGNELTDDLNWKELSLGGGGGLEIGDIGTALFVDETKGLRRKLNGSILLISANTQEFLNWLKNLQTTNPEFFTTEESWQAESLLNVDGCVYKFVINEEAGTIRLAKYPEYIEITADNIPVVGNGMALGLTNGAENYGLTSGTPTGTGYFMSSSQGAYGNYVGTRDNTDQINSPYNVGVTTDPAKSGIEISTTGIAKLKLYYFIQIATGAETEVNILNTLDTNTPYELFDERYSDHKLYNTSWLLSNNQWNPKAQYTKQFEALQVEYNSEVEEGETVTLPSGGTYTKKGLSVKLSTETFNDYDFVLNLSDETFRLKLKTNLAGSKAVVGNGMALGLTNGTLSGGLGGTSSLYGQVNMLGNPVGTATGSASNFSTKAIGIVTDPTKSGMELADSNLYLYFYVGETTQNVNLVNVGRIEELLVNKLDRGNKQEITRWSLPDYTAGITLTSSMLPYTAPVSGIAMGRIEVGSQATSGRNFRVDGSIVTFIGTSEKGVLFIPIQKGSTLTADNLTGFTFKNASFYPLKGDN